jgi:A/G-specific adenine glycosylase
VLLPQQRAGDFAQALMDLGATICTPKSPNCLMCPWTEECAGRAAGLASALPYKLAKKPVPTRRGHVYWLEREGHVLLRRRPDKGLLGGMMEVPSSDWAESFPGDDAGAPLATAWRKLPGLVEHTFTHFHLELKVWVATSPAPAARGPEWRWVKTTELRDEALPSIMRKVVAHVLKQ